jgi:hypothetical protein
MRLRSNLHHYRRHSSILTGLSTPSSAPLVHLNHHLFVYDPFLLVLDNVQAFSPYLDSTASTVGHNVAKGPDTFSRPPAATPADSTIVLPSCLSRSSCPLLGFQTASCSPLPPPSSPTSSFASSMTFSCLLSARSLVLAVQLRPVPHNFQVWVMFRLV